MKYYLYYYVCKDKETSNEIFIRTRNRLMFIYARSVDRKLEALRLTGIFY